MRIAPEGKPFILGAVIIGFVMILLGWTVTLAVWALVTVWVVAGVGLAGAAGSFGGCSSFLSRVSMST